MPGEIVRGGVNINIELAPGFWLPCGLDITGINKVRISRRVIQLPDLIIGDRANIIRHLDAHDAHSDRALNKDGFGVGGGIALVVAPISDA